MPATLQLLDAGWGQAEGARGALEEAHNLLGGLMGTSKKRRAEAIEAVGRANMTLSEFGATLRSLGFPPEQMASSQQSVFHPDYFMTLLHNIDAMRSGGEIRSWLAAGMNELAGLQSWLNEQKANLFGGQ